jgi:Rrf2 family protein
MVTIPRQVEYTLMVLAEMQGAPSDQLFPARAMCLKLRIPFEVTAKALQRLCHAEILHSVQGKYGGYQIARDLAELSLGELFDCVMGPNGLTPCLQPGRECQFTASCTIRRAMAQLNSRVDQLFRDTSVAELLS